jgi:hypothetical protein
MKKIPVLLIILILQPNRYLSAEKEVPFSFDDFLQQIEQDLSNKTQKQEQEIIDVLEKQIKPLATDLSKIVRGPEAEKALEEKKKQREQKQKEGTNLNPPGISTGISIIRMQKKINLLQTQNQQKKNEDRGLIKLERKKI